MWTEQKSNGSYIFRESYTHPMTGRRMTVSVTFPKNNARTKKQALELLNEKIRKKIIELGHPAMSSKEITLEDLTDCYLRDQSRSVSEATYRRNKFAVGKLKTILGANTRVSALTANYVRDKFNGTGDGPGTLNERLTRFKALMRWGYSNDYVEDIRFLDKLKKYPDPEKKERLEEKYLESEDLQKLIDGMEVTQWKLMTQLLALSGLRIGEALALQDEDIDLKNKYIHVRHTLDHVTLELVDPKTRESNRDVYIQQSLLPVIRQLLFESRKLRSAYGCKTTFLFFDANGGPQQYYTYNKYLRETAERVLGRSISTHIMRHTHTALMAEAGVPLEAISRRLGHADSAVTKNVYLHITEKMVQKDNEAYERMIL